MDFFGMDLYQAMPYLLGIIVSLIVAILAYFLWYKPRGQYPLPNERPLGFWEIYIPKGIGLKTGFAQTARHTVEELFTQITTDETDPALKEQLEEARKFVETFHMVAHKVEGESFIYLFDTNPEDQRFMEVDPYHDDSFIIHGVQDVTSVREWGKFKFLGVKLNPEKASLTDTEKQRFEVALEAVKYLRDAARNMTKLALLKEDNENKTLQLGKTLEDLGQTKAKLDRCCNALGKKTLTQPEEVKIPGALGQKLKQWFTWPQILVALFAYFALAPFLLQVLGWDLKPPQTTYFNGFVTVVGFFIIPLMRRLWHRLFG